MSDTKKYTYNDVYDASLEYFRGDELAAGVFVGKYALKDLDGNYYEKTGVRQEKFKYFGKNSFMGLLRRRTFINGIRSYTISQKSS